MPFKYAFRLTVALFAAAAILVSTGSAQISRQALDQIAALQREKESRTPAERKIDSRLLYTIKNVSGKAAMEGLPTLKTGLAPDANGEIGVDIRADVSAELLALLEKAGAKIIYQSAELRTVVARIPLHSIEALAESKDIHFIAPEEENASASITPNSEVSLIPASEDRFRTILSRGRKSEKRSSLMIGSATSQGDLTHRAALARTLSGSDGTGIKIGVLSDGVSSLAARQATGDLPANVTVVVAGPAGTEEGTAMLEIVHDIAPGAQLFFATATGSGSAAFANNIRTLRNVHGCDIIVDDWSYFAETPFQDGQAANVVSNTNGGVVVQAVNEVTAAGAIVYSSAGNSGNKNDGTAGAWEGNFVNGGASAAPLPLGLEVHDFGSAALFNTVTTTTTSTGAGTFLKWSDPLGGSSNDYDLYVLNAAGTSVVSAGTNLQTGTQDPMESVAQPATNTRLVIVRKAGAQDRFLHLNTNRGRLAISTSGVVYGHNAGRNTQSTAATPVSAAFPSSFRSTNSVETFSSDGPRRIFYNADSTALTPGNFLATGGELLAKPDITAADGVTTTTPGFLTFFGTSAAAPHAAAIAALIKSENPALTASQITTAMKDSAIDIEAPGYDRDSGAGIVMPLRAMATLGITGTGFIDAGTASVSQRIGNGNSTIDAGETWNLQVTLENVGLRNVTNVNATLTTSVPGVTIVPSATRSYGSMPAGVGSSNGGSPFAFRLATDFACGAAITFGLNITFDTDGGAGNVSTTVTVPTGNPTVISTTLDATEPPAGDGYTALTNNNQTSRLNRNGIISSCPTVKATPPLQDALTGRRFDQYTFTASAAGCVTVTIVPSNPTAFYSAAYNGTYDPLNIQANYIADYGVTTAGTIRYSFPVTAGQQYAVVVHEVNVGGGNGVNYTLNVDGPRTGGCSAPFAPSGDVRGRVLESNGRSIARAIVTITDGQGLTQKSTTNSFGYFQFTDLPARPYTITTEAKRYTFAPVGVDVGGDLTGLEINPTP